MPSTLTTDVDPEVIDRVQQLDKMDNRDEELINQKEVERTNNALEAGRDPGLNGIPAGVLKAEECNIVNLLLQVIHLCFNSGIVS